jgi:hypothetical protein
VQKTPSSSVDKAALLAQTEELIALGERNRVRALGIIERKIATGQLVDGAGDLLQEIEKRLARLHARRQRLLPYGS